MQLSRPANAVHPRQFGRRAAIQHDDMPPAERSIGYDLKLFATTFAAGFVFVTVLLA